MKKKRKLRTWVKVAMLASGIAMLGGVLLNVDKESQNANAEVVPQPKEYSYMEKFEMNEEISLVASKENSDKYKAFFLYEDEENFVYMSEDTMEKLYVDKNVVKKSYADIVQIGENVVLHGNEDGINAVEILGGRAVSMVKFELANKGILGATYKNDAGESYNVDKDFQRNFNLENSKIESLATGYFYKNELVAMEKGW